MQMKRGSGIQVDRRSLVETASAMVDIPSPTGDEFAMAEHMAGVFHEMGLHVQWQEVEEGRPNVVGTWRGAGGGKTLMFNGHMDTSYSGREPWLAGRRGFRPEARVEGDHLFGLGISNMKGALACYVEAVRARSAAPSGRRGRSPLRQQMRQPARRIESSDGDGACRRAPKARRSGARGDVWCARGDLNAHTLASTGT